MHRALRAMEREYQLLPVRKGKAELAFLRELGDRHRAPLGFSGAVDVKLLAPVFAGQVLEYRVTLEREIGNVYRFAVEATVQGRPVARGHMSASSHQVAAPVGESP